VKHQFIRIEGLRFDVQIVDQARFPDENREKHIAGLAHSYDRIKRLGIHDLSIVHAHRACKTVAALRSSAFK